MDSNCPLAPISLSFFWTKNFFVPFFEQKTKTKKHHWRDSGFDEKSLKLFNFDEKDLKKFLDQGQQFFFIKRSWFSFSSFLIQSRFFKVHENAAKILAHLMENVFATLLSLNFFCKKSNFALFSRLAVLPGFQNWVFKLLSWTLKKSVHEKSSNCSFLFWCPTCKIIKNLVWEKKKYTHRR